MNLEQYSTEENLLLAGAYDFLPNTTNPRIFGSAYLKSAKHTYIIRFQDKINSYGEMILYCNSMQIVSEGEDIKRDFRNWDNIEETIEYIDNN
jgi:hypothetical protein